MAMGQFNLLQKPGSQQRKLMKKLITWQVSNERNSDGLSPGMIDPEKKHPMG
jgi:squalene cyclase